MATKKNLTFEDIIGELEEITTQLERGAMPLNQAVDTYTKGIELKNTADQQLRDAYLKLQSVQEHKEISKFRESVALLFGNLREESIKLLNDKVDKNSIDTELSKFVEEFKKHYNSCSEILENSKGE